MKTETKLRNLLKLFLLLLLGVIASCDDDNELNNTLQNESQNLTSKTISGKDVPNIISFVKNQSNEELEFSLGLKNSANRSHENLTIGSIQTDEIKQITNDANRSNYTFKVDKQNSTDELSFINYTVKESPDGFYSYFLEYVPDVNWLKTTTNPNDLSNFTGEIRAYDRNGYYVGKNTFSNGTRVEQTYRNPCDDGSSGSGSGGGGGGSGSGSGTGSSGSGSGSGTGGTGGGSGTSGGGTGGHDIECIVIDISYNDDCTCQIAVVYTCEEYFENQKSANNPFRNPCTDDCNSQNDCEFGFDANCGCLPDPNDDTDDNPNDGINIDISELALAFEIEDQIISTNLDPCTNNILTQLKGLTQNDIAKIIFRFGSPNSTYDWELSLTTPSVPGNAAETDRRNGSTPYDYLTKIDPNYKNQATKIALARTMLHEMLHAYMISHIDDVNAGNTVDVRNFLQLWQFIRSTTSPGGSTQPAQHEYMAQRFLPHLKEALKEWDNAQQSDQYYEDLAWGALFNTGTFNHFHPVGSPSRNRIINTNNAEDTNSTQGGITPKGNPC